MGADVAKVLGYSNASKAVMVHVDDRHKAKVMVSAEGGARNGNLLRKSKNNNNRCHIVNCHDCH